MFYVGPIGFCSKFFHFLLLNIEKFSLERVNFKKNGEEALSSTFCMYSTQCVRTSNQYFGNIYFPTTSWFALDFTS